MKFLIITTLVALTLWSTNLKAQVKLYQKAAINAPACLTQEEAVQMAKADMEGGPQKAMEVFQKLDGCGWVQAQIVPKKVVFSGPTARGKTVRVLESEMTLGDGSTLIFYILVDVDVQEPQTT